MSQNTSTAGCNLDVSRARAAAASRSLFDRALTAVTVALRSVPRAPEARAAMVCGVVFVIAHAIVVSMRHMEFAREHLGGENGNIALALVNGRGFGDPFSQYTGPTAWMPPVLPMLLAALHLICRTQRLVALIFWGLSIGMLAAAGGVIYRIARERAQVLPASLAVCLYLGWVCLFNFYFIILTHDVAIITFLLSLIVWQVHRATRNAALHSIPWGALGGLSLLTSPATAAAWGVASVVLARLRFWNWRRVAAAMAVSAALGVPWMARNAVVFHQFIPVKSNLFCDLEAANYADDDGIWDYRSMSAHPYLSVPERMVYAGLGERRYISLHKRKFLKHLADDPQRYLSNVLRRTLAVSVRYVPSHTEADGDTEQLCKRIALPVFFLAALVSQFLKGPNWAATRVLGVVWLSFVLPYVAIGLHIRHVLPVSVALVVMAYLGIDCLAARFSVRWLRQGDVDNQGRRAVESSYQCRPLSARSVLEE